jgi:hypothetical protein
MPKESDIEEEKHAHHNLEQEIKEVVEDENIDAQEGEKAAAQPHEGKVDYKKNEMQQENRYDAGNPKEDYIESQEFYIKNEKDLDKVKDTIKEIKMQESSMSRVDDSETYEFEPETKKIKVRKMPRNTLDMLKQKGIVIDYYKQL